MGLSDLLGRIKNIFNDSVIGLDIGESTIKLVEVEREDGQFCLKKIVIADTPIGAVKEGKLVGVETIYDSLNNLLDQSNFETKDVVAAISGEEIITRNIEVPNMPQEELKETIKWEAEEQIPIPIDQVVYDYEILERKKDGGYKLLVIAVERSLIDKYLELFEMLKLKPLAIEIEPLALARVIEQSYAEETIGVIDIGVSNTDISILHNGKLLFTRTIGFGGEDITEDIAENNDLSFEEAEEYKRKNNLFMGESINLVLRNMSTEIYRSLDYFQVKNRDYDIERLILVGGGGKLKGLADHLTTEFGVEVGRFKLSKQRTIITKNVDNYYLSNNIELLGTSLGLGLRREEEDSD